LAVIGFAVSVSFLGEPRGCVSEVMCGQMLPRRRELDEIPSPYLTGLMDKFFDGILSPMRRAQLRERSPVFDSASPISNPASASHS
jgi:hypothetical protein